MIRYAITDRRAVAGDEAERRAALVRQAMRLALEGVDYLQVREKDLAGAEAAALALLLQAAVQDAGGGTAMLLNAVWPGDAPSGMPWPPGIGLHLAGPALREVVAARQRGMWMREALPSIVSASCHTVAEAESARGIADVLLFAPVFEKRIGGAVVTGGAGLEMLREVCRAVSPLPVLAMGGITKENAGDCLRSGAAGVAGIRMFGDGILSSSLHSLA